MSRNYVCLFICCCCCWWCGGGWGGPRPRPKWRLAWPRRGRLRLATSARDESLDLRGSRSTPQLESFAVRTEPCSKMAVAKCVTASGGAREDIFQDVSREPKRFGCAVRSRGARALDSCHGSSSKAARALVERFLTTAKMPPKATSKHALHHNGMRSLPWPVRRRPAAAALR
jgi:hypothetical protein